jgi:hypothetical protein
MLPNVSAIFCMPSTTEASFETSILTDSPPKDSHADSSTFKRRPVMATRHPWAAKPRAMANPMPDPPPVMTAFFPVSIKFIPLNSGMQKYTHV